MTGIVTAAIAALLLNLYALTLIFARGRLFGVKVYRPMVLNLGLSAVPIIAAIVLVVGPLLLTAVVAPAPAGTATVALWVFLIVSTAAWLVFFPNSTYLITELNFSHRRDDSPVPLWFDIIQTLALTLSGIANAVISLALVQTVFIGALIDPPAGAGVPVASWVFALTMIVAGAAGVYLGRTLRFNSWDMRHPTSLFAKLGRHLADKSNRATALGFVGLHAVLVALVYVPIYALAYAAVSPVVAR
ncbi:DUF1361 domain-containing protein [Demequina globuliformis]|uniref:DUF1361 domain-containing protein n=1 Tax=Demequina globuliformis TaxID=676202 RepID=UPI00078288E5|nr:DUF1361 domain-containing protein [Demequina globuliformis]